MLPSLDTKSLHDYTPQHYTHELCRLTGSPGYSWTKSMGP